MVPLRVRSGLTIFFTGLSGAGKTTLAEAPSDADVVIDTTDTSGEAAAGGLIRTLAGRGCLMGRFRAQ